MLSAVQNGDLFEMWSYEEFVCIKRKIELKTSIWFKKINKEDTSNRRMGKILNSEIQILSQYMRNDEYH